MNVLTLWVFIRTLSGSDPESVGAEEVTLSLDQVGGEGLGSVAVKEGQLWGEEEKSESA